MTVKTTMVRANKHYMGPFESKINNETTQTAIFPQRKAALLLVKCILLTFPEAELHQKCHLKGFDSAVAANCSLFSSTEERFYVHVSFEPRVFSRDNETTTADRCFKRGTASYFRPQKPMHPLYA